MYNAYFFRLVVMLTFFSFSSTSHSKSFTIEQYLIKISRSTDFEKIKQIAETNQIDTIEINDETRNEAGRRFPKSIYLLREGELIATIVYPNHLEENSFDINVANVADRHRGLGTLLIILFNEEFFGGHMCLLDWSFSIVGDNMHAFEAALATGSTPSEACWATPIGHIFNNHLDITPENYDAACADYEPDYQALISFNLSPESSAFAGFGS